MTRLRRFAALVPMLSACAAEEVTQSACGASVVCVDSGATDAGPRDAALDGANDLGGGFDVAREAAVNRVVEALEVRPGTATLTVRGADTPTQDFVAYGHLSDGTEAAITSAVWSLAPTPVATIDTNTGRVTATGRAGGTVSIEAQSAGGGGRLLSARATLNVNVERVVLGASLVPDVAERFAGTPVEDPSRAVGLLYPLDGAVIPNNLLPIDVQWERGSEGDVFRVRLSRPHVTVTAYVLHDGGGFGYHWLADADAWRAVLESDPTEPLTVSVDRWEAASREVVRGAPVTLRVARATLSGTLYYWDLSDGRISRIDALTGVRDIAIPNPPARPSDGRRCVACHTVSRDGRWLSAELWDGGDQSVVFDLSASNLNDDPAPTVFGPRAGTNYLFSTFSPDGNYLVINNQNWLRLIRRETGDEVMGANLPTAGAAHPEWSPDGMSIAYVSNTDGSWAVDFARGDLSVIPRTGETSFGEPRLIHAGASTPGGPVAAHPSYSPDGRFIAFQHGVNSRGGNEATHYPGRLEMLPSDATAPSTPTVLAAANGPGEPSSYWPNFSPFVQGGYYWLAFYSRRDYGNAQVGTRGSRRRQLWVTAVSTSGGAPDPSNVPYWLPGQRVASENMSAYWAPVACRSNGTACSVSGECCSGNCLRQADGSYACMPAPPAMCRRAGTTCATDADCCEGLMCVANICGAPPG